MQTPQCDIEHLIVKHNAVTLYEANEKAALFITPAIVRRRSRGIQVLQILVTAFFFGEMNLPSKGFGPKLRMPFHSLVKCWFTNEQLHLHTQTDPSIGACKTCPSHFFHE